MSNKRLYDLQEMDWEISDSETSLADVRARLKDESEINAARTRLARLTARLDELAPIRANIESSLSLMEERLGNAERRLYGGAVTNPRELEAAEEERRTLQEQRADEEDRMLDVMVEVEELQQGRDSTQELLSRLLAERETEYVELLERQDVLVAKLDELRGQRRRITPDIPVATLSVYETLLKSRGGHAVAKVERGLCQGCRLALPTMENQRAKTSQNIVQCSSCQRILYSE